VTTAEQIVALLTEIRDLLKTPMQPEASSDPEHCVHPDDKRVSLKAMGTRGTHYLCSECGTVVRTTSYGVWFMAPSAIGRHVLDSALVQLTSNLHDISNRVESVELMTGTKAVPVTAFGDGWDNYKPSKINHWSLKLTLFQDYTTDTTGDVFTELQTFLTGNVPIQVTVFPTTGLRGTLNGNPGFQGNIVIDGDFAQIAAQVGQANKTTVTFRGAGALTFLTSSTS